jgi:hypothetical protein
MHAKKVIVIEYITVLKTLSNGPYIGALRGDLPAA